MLKPNYLDAPLFDAVPPSHSPLHFSFFIILLSPELRQHVAFLRDSSVSVDLDDSEDYRRCF